MLYTQQLKDILSSVRSDIESGNTTAALHSLELADKYADFHQFEDERITPAIRKVAKELNITEPEALESITFYGFYEAGRIVAGAGFDILGQMMAQRKLETSQMMMPYFGVTAMSAQEESNELSRINAEKRGA